MTQPTSPRIRQAYAVGCSLLLGTALLFAGSLYFWATRPIASEAQIQAAAARVAQARNEMPTSCPRPVLRGVALPGDGAEGLRGFTHRFPDCFLLLAAEGFTAREVILRDEVFRASEAPARLATAAPLPFEQLVAVECAGVDTAVQELLQHASGCTAHPIFLASRDAPNTRGIEEAMFLLARARIHAGRLQEGVELVLDVIRLGQDLTRGAANLSTAHEGLLLQSEAAQQLEALLASDLPWTGAMLDELARQAQVLVSTMPEPTAWFAYETLSVRRAALVLRSFQGELLTRVLQDVAAEDYAETRWPECAGVTLQACTALYRAEIADVSARVVARYRWDWIPGVERQTGIEATYVQHLRERRNVLVEAAHNEALLRALPALFLHRRMSLSGTCPTAATLQAEALAAGMAGGFEIVDSARSILLNPPGVFSTSTVPVTPRPNPETQFLYRAFCPSLREP